jgi:hypothetical protein
VPTRQAAVLTGLVRSTAIRHGRAALALTPPVSPRPVAEPVNKLTVLERLRILEVLTSARFVDLAPLQIYAQLLDEGLYLCSVSTMYLVLADNKQHQPHRRNRMNPTEKPKHTWAQSVLAAGVSAGLVIAGAAGFVDRLRFGPADDPSSFLRKVSVGFC